MLLPKYDLITFYNIINDLANYSTLCCANYPHLLNK